MMETITIRLPRKMPLSHQLSEVKRQLSAWLESIEEPFDVEKNRLKLAQFEINAKEYFYSYAVISREDISASRANQMDG